jgi:hypothetical protein
VRVDWPEAIVEAFMAGNQPEMAWRFITHTGWNPNEAKQINLKFQVIMRVNLPEALLFQVSLPQIIINCIIRLTNIQHLMKSSVNMLVMKLIMKANYLHSYLSFALLVSCHKWSTEYI